MRKNHNRDVKICPFEAFSELAEALETNVSRILTSDQLLTTTSLLDKGRRDLKKMVKENSPLPIWEQNHVAEIEQRFKNIEGRLPQFEKYLVSHQQDNVWS